MKNALDWATLALVVIGGLNWGLVGLADYNLVDSLFGMQSMLAKIIYVLVGLSALYVLWMALQKKNA